MKVFIIVEGSIDADEFRSAWSSLELATKEKQRLDALHPSYAHYRHIYEVELDKPENILEMPK